MQVFTDTAATVTDTDRIIMVQPDFFVATQNLQTTPEIVGNQREK